MTRQNLPHGGVGFRAIANARTAAERLLWDQISEGGSKPLHLPETPHDIDPEDLFSLATGLDCRIDLTWSQSGHPDDMDVVFRPKNAPDMDTATLFGHPPLEQVTPQIMARHHANNPLFGRMIGPMTRKLRQFAGQHLPAYMTPNSFVIL